jgi:ammonia channel protein AmtB
MFMQVGFAMMETGFTRAKNAVNTMAMNMIIYPVGVLGFWLCGFGFMMGGVSRLAHAGGGAGARARDQPAHRRPRLRNHRRRQIRPGLGCQ